MVSTFSHIREIERVAMGDASYRDAPVIRSWLRRLNNVRLGMAIAHEAYAVPESKLREHLKEVEEPIRIGRSEVETLFTDREVPRHVTEAGGERYARQDPDDTLAGPS